MKVKNIQRKNRAVRVGEALVQFDADGVADVERDVFDILTQLAGYTPVAAPVPDPAPAAAEPDSGSLEALSAAQLKKLARDKGIDTGDATKKADLIRVIEAAQA